MSAESGNKRGEPSAPTRPAESGDSGREIRVLPDHIADQIAAGEVVERPASVVKELVENALDAGASHITVEVDLGGKRLIRVVDNGCGMTVEQARLALVRHATSKLRSLDDIFSLATMGFRGEALPSIAAVSKLTLTTRVRDQVAGIKLDVDAGEVRSESEVGAPVGTQIEVRDLLYNVPARLKFLKGNATEASHITDAVSKLAMAHPAVHLRLRHGSRTAIDAPRHATRLERVKALLGARFAGRLHQVRGEENGIAVDAFLTAPELAQTTGRGVQIFVGRRPVKDRGLMHAIKMGYGELVPKGRYPVSVLFVDIPTGAVDVNVHPQKLEVRFSEPEAVYAAVRHVIRRGVATAPWLGDKPGQGSAPVQMRAIASSGPPRRTPWPGDGRASGLAAGHAAETTRMLLPFDRPGGRSGRPQPAPPHAAPVADARPPREPAPGELREASFPLAPAAPAAGGSLRNTASRAAQPNPWPYRLPDADAHPAPADGDAPAPASGDTPASGGPAPASGDTTASGGPAPASGGDRRAPGDTSEPTAGFFTRLRYIGQLDRTYLVCELDSEMVLVDQHAAHERVAFQRLRERYHEREIPVQRVLFAHTVELSPDQSAVASESHAELAKMGFELEPLGQDTYALKTVPSGLQQSDAHTVLVELLGELAERGGSRALEERLELALATIACHSVVRAGDALSTQEVYALFESLDSVDFRAHCPHGRPVLLRISVAEIARRFGRT